MASIFKINGTGAAGLATSCTVPVGDTYRVHSVTLHLNAAPTTSEDFTITLDADAGAAYDTLLYSLDLSTASTTDLLWQPDAPLFLEGGDALDVAYTNTDTGTYGVQITVEEID
jgi:hypothetical protein